MLSRLLSRPSASLGDDIPLERILDSLDMALVVIDAAGHILAANHRWHDLSGHPSRRLFHEYLHPGDRSAWQQALLKPDPTVSLRLLLPEHDDCRWYELKLAPLTPGIPWPLSITLTDISTRMQVDRQRDAEWRSLTQLVSLLPAMLYRGRNNRDWSMEYVSDGCLELTGYAPEVLTHQSCLNYGDLIHPEDANPVWEQVQDAISRQQTFELHYRLQHADGRLIPVCEKGRGLYADNGAILGVEGVVLAFSTPSSYPHS
ncbi:PAS domain-containing protein [Marinobacterium sediminicola]|uniref:histidine kinase n=1 Tax=Marinobacterium sediminicola TaxID=518898 RepID=A0ABY1S251_9GAMM|nr:PAS domain-containing protein [Marinobacterium sediminicola]ULG69462.1 PAS domain-containing protein [Marinobacterium sediminicola]SMR75612.1 PAS domain S-box-containing protein [Marinobacterium sediminicola]